MTNNILKRKEIFKRLIAPAVLLAALISPLVMTEARQSRLAGGPAQTPDSTQDATAPQGTIEPTSDMMDATPMVAPESAETITVVKQIYQAQVTEAQIQTLVSIPALRRLVSIQGNIIKPLEGNSLWLLSNHSYGVVGGSTVAPLASEIWIKVFDDGSLYFAACYCPGSDPNQDDGCAFDGSPSELHCHQGGGQDCHCRFVDAVIGPDGTPQFITPN